MVPRNEYLSASTWNSTGWQLGAITGPAVGGLVYALGGPMPCYTLVAALTMLGTVFLLTIKKVDKPVIQNAEPIKIRLFSGIRFVFKTPIILGALSLDLFAVLFGGAVALLPVFASDILKVGPEGLGILRAAPAVGSTLMAFIMAYRKPMKNAGVNLLLAVAGFGITSIVFGLSESFTLSVLMLGIGGALDNVSVIIRSVILQMLTPDDMRGRVSAVNSIFIGSSNEIGAFESGLAASLLGIIPSVVFGGVMTLAVVAFTWWKAPSLRRLDLRALQQTHLNK
jgi:predicted MFS family arabinose efflux permease